MDNKKLINGSEMSEDFRLFRNVLVNATKDYTTTFLWHLLTIFYDIDTRVDNKNEHHCVYQTGFRNEQGRN